jgi:ribosomal protein S18 acetylase RimI-like enzyme
MLKQVRRYDPLRRDDFFRLHCDRNDAGWCHCVAWWVPTWDEWGQRSAEDNRLLREELLERGEYDGYLLYVDREPAGWCQTGPRDRLLKLVRQFRLDPSPGTWAITCFLIAPRHRRRGLARFLLHEVLKDLPARGATRVEVYPRRGTRADALDLWTGPEPLFVQAGFELQRDHPRSPVYALQLGV